MEESNNSGITGRHKSCATCQLISSCGLIGAGLYVYHHSKKFEKKSGKSVMISIASVLILYGAARLITLPYKIYSVRDKQKESD